MSQPHNTNDEEWFPCPYCPYEGATWAGGLTRHISARHRAIHNGDEEAGEWHTCRHCGVFQTTIPQHVFKHFTLCNALQLQGQHGWEAKQECGDPGLYANPPDHATEEDRIRWEFVAYFRHLAREEEDSLAKSVKGGWDQTQFDELSFLGWATKYGVSDTGFEELMRLLKDIGQGCARIDSLPRSWRTLVSHAMQDYDYTPLKSFKFPVPEHLKLGSTTEVEFVVKDFRAVVMDLLANSTMMQHGNFYFSAAPQSEGKPARNHAL